VIKRIKAGFARVRSLLPVAVAAALALGVQVSAFAQTEPPAPVIDYAEILNAGKGEIYTAVGAIAPVAITIMAGLVAVGLAVRWFKRAAKSS
jgi:hypothetical protein